MLIAIYFLYICSALFPIWGLIGFARRTRADAKKVQAAAKESGGTATYGAFQAAAPATTAQVAESFKRAVRDLVLIGAGLVAGAVAGVLSLHLG